ncbi:12184_t:CDS:2 [Funneliformis geosporum]|uniref:NADH-cytochrome b5 reductase n=1 Tax=Funneliformis geosporum TaxID=1117311 RepID=A0A9W4SHE0_9GLOM|nr:12184_t:CDS:2 [Funneliformis geosporum]
MSSKAILEISISVFALGGSYYFLPDIFPAIVALVAGSWIKYLYFDNKKQVLDPEKWQEFPLTEKIKISHDVALYRIGLPKPDDVLGLPIGQHISVQAEINGKLISRSYTPTSSDDDLGHFDLVIKSYPSGNISRYFGENLEIGQKISVKGPKGQFIYSPGLVRAFGMIAGGTGITPMLQIIRAITKNPEDKTIVSLIFANQTEKDILLKDELDDLAAKHDNFTVFYTLDRPQPDWAGGSGFVTPEVIKKHCPPPADDIKILLCGPTPMVSAMAKHCESLGYKKARTISKLEDQVFKF